MKVAKKQKRSERARSLKQILTYFLNLFFEQSNLLRYENLIERCCQTNFFRLTNCRYFFLQELEINLDHANKTNADAQKTIKRYVDQIREMQTALEDEQRKREELRQGCNALERRFAVAQAEKEDLQARIVQVREYLTFIVTNFEHFLSA